MRVACCISGNQPIPLSYKSFIQDFEDVVYFQYTDPDNRFDKNIEKLSIDKQNYELSNRLFFDMCVYLNTNIFLNYTIPKFQSLKKNTVYTYSNFINDEEEKLFNLFPQYYVDNNFFYCDSKTFNVIGTFSKFESITAGHYRVPEKTFFYSFIQNMGIKNRSLTDD